MHELAQPLLAVARAQAQLHAKQFAAEAADTARDEAGMERAAARLKESYYALAAQKTRLEQQLVGGWPKRRGRFLAAGVERAAGVHPACAGCLGFVLLCLRRRLQRQA